jgi:hypothetical protein
MPHLCMYSSRNQRHIRGWQHDIRAWVTAPPLRVSTPLVSQNARRRLIRTPRTPMPPPIFDLYKQRRQTKLFTARPQSPELALPVQWNLMQDLAPATSNLMDDIHAKGCRLYNMHSRAHMHEENRVSIFILDPDPSVTANYYMPMHN